MKIQANSASGVLYASTFSKPGSKEILEAALATFLKVANSREAKLMYCLYYEQKQALRSVASLSPTSRAPLDLAFNDEMLDDVEEQWKMVMGDRNATEQVPFMVFDDRQGIDNDDDEVDDGF